MKKIIKFIILWLIFIDCLILLISGVAFYMYVLKPSMYSLQVGCGIISEKQLLEKGYVVGGSYSPQDGTIKIIIPKAYDYSWQLINMYMDSEEYRIKARHENIHKIQAKQNRTHLCNNKLGLFFNEIEAYYGQYFPDWLYYKLYG